MRNLRTFSALMTVALLASVAAMCFPAGPAGASDAAVLDGWGFLLPNVPTLIALPAGVAPADASSDTNSWWVLSTTGKVYAWGANDHGQLGDGTLTNRSTPVLVALPAGEVVVKLQAEV